MAEVQHSQIKSKLLELIAPHIDKSDITAKSGPERDAHILSRSMAAVAIKMLAEIDDATAANSIVDGGQDNGIDAIFYDPQSKTLFLVPVKMEQFTFNLDRKWGSPQIPARGERSCVP
ncbi:MAG TPA: hypothetical protein VGH13_20825 [Xanthobacteraceae bacterium]|jgi:hypothetical protein